MDDKKNTTQLSDPELVASWFGGEPAAAQDVVQTIPTRRVQLLPTTFQGAPAPEQQPLLPYPRFFELHRMKLLSASLGVFFSLLTLYLLGDLLSKLGVVQPFYFGVVMTLLLTCAFLPVHWLLRYRRMRAVWNAEDGSNADELKPTLRPLWEGGSEAQPEVAAAHNSQS